MQFHVDPLNILIVLGTAIGIWVKFLRKDTVNNEVVGQLVAWTKQHGIDCDELRKQNGAILTALQVSNATLTKVAESQDKRIERIERQLDR